MVHVVVPGFLDSKKFILLVHVIASDSAFHSTWLFHSIYNIEKYIHVGVRHTP